MAGDLRGNSAIVGTGHAGFGEAYGLTAYDIRPGQDWRR